MRVCEGEDVNVRVVGVRDMEDVVPSTTRKAFM